jgi:hypothetical protein
VCWGRIDIVGEVRQGDVTSGGPRRFNREGRRALIADGNSK